MMNRENKRTKRVSGIMKKRLYFILACVLAMCGVLIARLVYLNNEKGERYARAVLSQQSYVNQAIPSRRGSIYDRNGIELARSIKIYNVILDPKVIQSQDYYVEPTMEALTEIMKYDEADIRRLLEEQKQNSYVVYEENIDYERVSAFKSYASKHKFVKGVWFEEEYVREYPCGSLASHVIGFCNDGKSGSYGIEQYYNNELNGTDGMQYGYYDAELNMQKSRHDAVDGHCIISTIDYNIQTVVQKYVSDFIQDKGCNNIGVIAMNPNNGEVLAMASNNEFDLNAPMDISCICTEEEISNMSDEERLEKCYSMWKNFCITDTYEPGSTFKTITVAAALEEGIISPADTLYCKGFEEIGGWRISCNNRSGHGTLTLAEALMKSCNCALMDIVARLGADDFYRYQTNMGFGSKTGVDLVGEAKGILIPRKTLNVTELATSSFGTTFNVTMIQMAAAYASIFNGGSYYKPHVVKKITTCNGICLQDMEDVKLRETISERSCDFIRDALYMTVENGTAKPAQVKGYPVGGKTGTAQKKPKEDKKYVVSFVGGVPADKPEIMIYIVMDEIHDLTISGSSSSATTMFSEISRDILPYLNLYPQGEIDYNIDMDMILGENGETGNPDEDESNPDVLPEDLNINPGED